MERGESEKLELINDFEYKLRNQITSIKETIKKVLREDTKLADKIKILFREQGITIISILTAFGMIIGVIIEAIIPTGGGGNITPVTPPKEDIKDWIKKHLKNLGKLLANLAGKAAEALPGIIGSIISFLLSSTGKIINWFGENLWALIILVAGLLYAAAREYISNSHK